MDSAERRRAQRETILGLMQWCTVCGHDEVKTQGVGGKAQHKSYMYTTAERKEMLKTKEQIEEMRLSHGWSDDDSYDPLAAVQAQPAPAPEDEEEQSDHGVRPSELGPPPPDSTDAASSSD